MPKAKLTINGTAPDVVIKDEYAVVGTDEQELIWRTGLDSQGPHIVVKSVAGSGKTFTGVELCKRLPSTLKVAFVAFNKHIADELKKKLEGHSNVQAMTYHSLGLRALRSHYGQVYVEDSKVDTLLDSQKNFYKGWSDSKVRYVQARTRRLVSLAKQYGAWTKDELEKLVDHHDLDLTNIEEEVYELTPAILKLCLKFRPDQVPAVDFDDMVWMPKQVEAKMPRYDVMLIDEAQDTNLSQQWLALNGAERLIVVGDPFQSIYGFRGSDGESMNRLKQELQKSKRGCVELGLTFTRRCPKSHVKMAQKIVPNIQPLADAPDGIVRVESTATALAMMKPGDLVVCRVNAPLLETAYSLLKLGTRAVVRGRDIGEGIRKLIEQAQKRLNGDQLNDVGFMLAAAETVTMELVDRLSKRKNSEARISAAHDKMACLSTLAEGAVNVSELSRTIARLFDDFDDDGRPQAAVVLGTVHRTKGLEAYRVFVLSPDKIPHPMAKRPWEQQQEMNLAYVAVTRAKYGEVKDQKIGFQSGSKSMVGELIFVGQECSLWPNCDNARPVAIETRNYAVDLQFSNKEIEELLDSEPYPEDFLKEDQG